MLNRKKVQYKAVDTMQEVVKFLRDEEVRVLKLETESEYKITDTDLLESISEDPRSPRLLDVLTNQLCEDDVFYEVEDLETDDREEVVIRVVSDGTVYYKQTVDSVIIYDLGELTGKIGAMPAWDEDVLYVPDLYDLEEAYDNFQVFEEVLRSINRRGSLNIYNCYDSLYMDLLDDELYGYVKRYCDGYYMY